LKKQKSGLPSHNLNEAPGNILTWVGIMCWWKKTHTETEKQRKRRKKEEDEEEQEIEELVAIDII
jgi:hypothetical protein